jgi:hypothetical protein
MMSYEQFMVGQRVFEAQRDAEIATQTLTDSRMLLLLIIAAGCWLWYKIKEY